MSRASTSARARRTANAAAIAAFGVDQKSGVDGVYRTIHCGKGPTVYTIGYERRDAEGLISCLRDVGVEVLADVRERPFSRVPDFRKEALRRACEAAGIEYQLWDRLGSTDSQRDALRASGDFAQFRRRFRDLVVRGRDDDLQAMARLVRDRAVAMICYERCHEECHRSVLAELLHQAIDANVVAVA